MKRLNIKDKIRKRIKTMEMAQGKVIDEIQITKQEAEQLGSINAIDGVKLVIVEKLGDMTKKDCFAYRKNRCYALNDLYCRNRKCRFYRKDITIAEIESSVRRYSKV